MRRWWMSLFIDRQRKADEECWRRSSQGLPIFSSVLRKWHSSATTNEQRTITELEDVRLRFVNFNLPCGSERVCFHTNARCHFTCGTSLQSSAIRFVTLVEARLFKMTCCMIVIRSSRFLQPFATSIAYEDRNGVQPSHFAIDVANQTATTFRSVFCPIVRRRLKVIYQRQSQLRNLDSAVAVILSCILTFLLSNRFRTWDEWFGGGKVSVEEDPGQQTDPSRASPCVPYQHQPHQPHTSGYPYRQTITHCPLFNVKERSRDQPAFSAKQAQEAIFTIGQEYFGSNISASQWKAFTAMPGQMSIDWLLNEDEQSGLAQQQSSSPSQDHDARSIQQPQVWAANEYPRPMLTASSPVLYRVDQQPNPAYPSLNVRQHRASSVTSRTGSASRSSQPRPPRPKYSEEEDHFIWYQRIDLEKDWKEVSHAFNAHFQDRHRDGESGLQCRFYRILDANGVPNIRSLKNSNDKERIAQFGLVKQTRHRYGWMQARHRAA